jgi:hypothetical protein
MTFAKTICVLCKCEAIAPQLLCDSCLAKSMGEEVVVERLGNKCKECDCTAATLVDGTCNTCLSNKDKEDVIHWPKHYNTGNIQPIDVIEDWKLDFRLANALKYIARAGKKDPTKTKQDLEKCIWYVQRYINKELKDE